MRECGILLPVASLPSPYGIGAFSKEAYHFVDMLANAGQSYWQILPLGPTGYGDSPYQSFSAFAGNPYFIDLESLTQDGLLTEKECREADFGDNPRDIDYGKIYAGRFTVLKKAYRRWNRESSQRKALRRETEEYCFYMAVKNHFGGRSWDLWDEDIRSREPEAVARYRSLLADEIGFYEFLQIKFQEQWKRLKSYANRKNIRIIGDIPIYVAMDSADTWFHPELFQFGRDGRPTAVAGCPPDDYALTGQLWGNPLYDWKYHKKTSYRWWRSRMEYSFKMYDVVRMDHFRGFDEYYSIPAMDETAEHGVWKPGPGLKFFQTLEKHFGKMSIIVEDLGFLTPSVIKMVKASGYPSMKVLEFAFDAGGESTYLPHNYSANCAVYTGTHDNDTIKGWYKSISQKDREFVVRYMNNGRTRLSQIHWDFIRLALSSVSDLAVIPMQDYLGLGTDARINEPSTIGKNWRWRMLPDEFTEELAQRCREMALLYGRVKNN